MPLTQRDKAELAIATVILVAYVGGRAFGSFNGDGGMLIELLVLASIATIYGDNALKYRAGGGKRLPPCHSWFHCDRIIDWYLRNSYLCVG